MRDLATYESSVCEEMNLRKTMIDLYKKVTDVKGSILNQTSNFSKFCDNVKSKLTQIEEEKAHIELGLCKDKGSDYHRSTLSVGRSFKFDKNKALNPSLLKKKKINTNEI